jgi:hypothetical protein
MKRILSPGLCVFLLSLATPIIVLADDKPLPKIQNLTAYGCSVELMVLEQKHWHAYVWAEHGAGNRDWKMLYSRRQGKRARKKCLSDCDTWMRQVEKLKRCPSQ